MADKIYKIRHIPTGLYYCSKKGRWKDTVTNLSKKGNHYLSEVMVNTVMAENCSNVSVNKAQTDRFNLSRIINNWSYNKAEFKDFKIIEFELKEINHGSK